MTDAELLANQSNATMWQAASKAARDSTTTHVETIELRGNRARSKDSKGAAAELERFRTAWAAFRAVCHPDRGNPTCSASRP